MDHVVCVYKAKRKDIGRFLTVILQALLVIVKILRNDGKWKY